MKRLMTYTLVILAGLVAFAPMVLAQGEPVPPINWAPIVAAGIGLVVMVVVELLKRVWPGVNPSVKQIVALVAAPALTWLASYIETETGALVDFQSLIEFLTAGGVSALTAMGSFDLLKSLGVLGKGGVLGGKA